MKAKNYKQCNDCVYFDLLFDDCAECDNGSRQLTHGDFNSDMEIYNDDNCDVNYNEEQKPKYFLIRWLIYLMLIFLNEDGATWFSGIERKPFGDKQEEDYFPLWLHVFFPIVYIDQWRNGGYSGDDFAGDMYSRLLPFWWLKFSYEM